MWSHRLPAGEYPFVPLRTASGGALTASAGHLIYASRPRRVDPPANTGVARGKRQCAPDTDAGTQAAAYRDASRWGGKPTPAPAPHTIIQKKRSIFESHLQVRVHTGDFGHCDQYSR